VAGILPTRNDRDEPGYSVRGAIWVCQGVSGGTVCDRVSGSSSSTGIEGVEWIQWNNNPSVAPESGGGANRC